MNNPRYTIYIEEVDLDAEVVFDHTEQRYLRVEEYADRLNRLDALLIECKSSLEAGIESENDLVEPEWSKSDRKLIRKIAALSQGEGERWHRNQNT
jgi:hypothetical protein